MYYLNNGSRARVIVSPFFLSQRGNPFGYRGKAEGGGVGLLCFESRKKTERTGKERGEVKFRVG